MESDQVGSFDVADDFESLPIFIIDAFLLAFLLCVYASALFYLISRRHYQPLKNRGANLIMISTLGNYLFAITLIINKMIANAFKVGSFYDCRC